MSILASNNSLAGRLLGARRPGLLDGAAPVEGPSIFNPPAEPQPQPAPQLVQSMQQQQQAGQDPQVQAMMEMTRMTRDKQIAERAQGIAAVIGTAAGGNVPSSALNWISETARAEVDGGGPGQSRQGILARLFVGDRPPGIRDEEWDKIRRQSFIMAGISILASAGAPLGLALAVGVLKGREAATVTIGQLMDERERQQRAMQRYALLGDSEMTELERWSELRRQAVALGDMDGAKFADSIIERLRELEAGAAERTVFFEDGRAYARDKSGSLYDPFSGERLTAPPEPGSKLVQVQTPAGPRTFRESPDGTLTDPFSGQVVQRAPEPAPDADDWQYDSSRGVQINKRTGAVRQLGLDPVEKSPPMNVQQAAAMAEQMDAALTTIEAYLSEHGKPPSNWTRRAYEGPAAVRGRVADADQGFFVAMDQLMLNVTRELFGARVTPEQKREVLRAFGIQAGDTPGNIRSTLEQLRMRQRALAQMGRSGAGGDDSGGDDDYDALFR
jgi:hypothetical protein